MRYLHVTETFPEIGPYIDGEVLGGWLHEHINRDVGGFLPEDEVARLYPDAMTAWRALNDETGEGSQGLLDEIEGFNEIEGFKAS